jgi:hypothetical protein
MFSHASPSILNFLSEDDDDGEDEDEYFTQSPRGQCGVQGDSFQDGSV